MQRKLTRTETFLLLGIFFVSGIISLYLFLPDTESVGPDQPARTVHADLVATLRRIHNVGFVVERLI